MNSFMRTLVLFFLLFNYSFAVEKTIDAPAYTRAWELRCAKRASIETITTTNTQILVMQNHAIISLIKAIYWANRHAGCI
jgi:hypothetical protein